MNITIEHRSQKFRTDLSKPIDISIPIKKGIDNVNAYYAPAPDFIPFKSGNFIGSVSLGGAVNYKNIFFNPHGNGTHTECVGHIAKEDYSINICLNRFFFMAELISINPLKKKNGDKIITLKQVREKCNKLKNPEALIIRTLPNSLNKLNKNYSGTNPPFIQHQACSFLQKKRVKHLLIDLPSVDKEKDNGKLLAHHAFWQYPLNTRLDCTITELIFVPAFVKDGIYLLNLQIASFENDASPSKPVLFKLIRL